MRDSTMKVITPEEAAHLVEDKDTLAIGGFGYYSGPDALLKALGQRHRETGYPVDLTVVTGVCPGNNSEDDVGMNRIAMPELVDTIICAHMGNTRHLARMASRDQIATYLLPLGVLVHQFRAIAGKRPGVMSDVGIGTFVDPRLEGGKVNERARQQGKNVVELIHVGEQECLFYPSFPVDICFLRGTYADEDGNISVDHEGMLGAEMEIAAAVRSCGGIVVVQVEELVQRGTIHPRKVHIHNKLVDYVVKAPSPELHLQTYSSMRYRPELTGDLRCSTGEIAPMSMGIRKVIARRSALELRPNNVVNLGIGLPSGVGLVASEEEVYDQLIFSLESGVLGGVPLEGGGFGGAINPDACVSACSIFDLYDGGFLDLAFLGAAEIDEKGNVNASRFGDFCYGPGGFTNISQKTPKVVFMCTFTCGKNDVEVRDGQLTFASNCDSGTKFVKEVQQVTFSADYAQKTGQEVMYITERAVFRLTDRGIMLTEVAPGVDLEKDIFAHMAFRPLVADQVIQMDARVFRSEKMGAKADPSWIKGNE